LVAIPQPVVEVVSELLKNVHIVSISLLIIIFHVHALLVRVRKTPVSLLRLLCHGVDCHRLLWQHRLLSYRKAGIWLDQIV
jgi:hypothetical protein